MNIDTADKKTIKKFITTYLSLQATFGIVAITIMIVFGTMLINHVMEFQAEIHGRLHKKSGTQ